MNLVRKIKISKLTNIKFTEEEQKIVDLTEKKFRYLSGHEYENGTIICYTNVCNDFAFEVCTTSKKVYIERFHLWHQIEKEIGYNNTQEFLSYMLKSKYKQYSDYYVMPKY